MTVAVSNVTVANTFGQLINKVNTLAALASANVLTVGGSNAVGNCTVTGVISANQLATDVLTTRTGNTLVQSTVLVIDTTASFKANGNSTFNGLLTANVITVTGTATFTNSVFVVANGFVGMGPGMGTPTKALSVNGAIWATGDIQAFQTSDINFKEHVQPLDLGRAMEVVGELAPISFDWRTDVTSPFVAPARPHDFGFIAQQVQAIVPEIVEERPDGSLALDKLALLPFLWRVVQDQQLMIEDLSAQVGRLANRSKPLK